MVIEGNFALPDGTKVEVAKDEEKKDDEKEKDKDERETDWSATVPVAVTD